MYTIYVFYNFSFFFSFHHWYFENSQVCDYPDQAGCENLSTDSTNEPSTDYTTTQKSTTEEWTTELTTPGCRDSMMSLVTHKSDCTKFYLNIRGSLYEVQCDVGKMFDSKAEVRFSNLSYIHMYFF